MTAYEKRVATMVRRASAGGNVALHGGPGSGKSYTAKRLMASLVSEHGIDCIGLDLSTFATGAEVLSVVVRQLGGDVRKSASVHDAWSAVQRLEIPRTTCLVLDEFDAVARLPDGDNFLLCLRELVHNSHESKISAIVASRRNIRILEESVRGVSTLEGVFSPVYLSTLGETDIIRGWEGSGGVPDWGQLMSWTGGVPRLIDVYLRSDILGNPSAEADLARQEWIERQLDYFDSVGLGGAVAQYVLGPVVRKDPAARARLLAMRVLSERADADEPALQEFPVLTTSLRTRHEGSLSAWGGLGEAEVAARRLVRSVLGDAKTRPASVDEVIEHAKGVLREQGVFDPSLQTIVSTFRRGDHWRVVGALWDDVGDKLDPPNRTFWKLRLQELGGVGLSPGEFWDVDLDELELWAAQIATARPRSESRDDPGPGRGGWDRARITVNAGGGSSVGIGSSPAPTSISSTTSAEASNRFPRTRLLVTWLGAFASVAGIGTFVYYLIDR